MLLGKYPLSTLWLYCRDVSASLQFYRDRLGISTIDEEGGTAHLNAGGIRLSLHPAESDCLPAKGSFFVFLISEKIDAVYQELVARGIEFEGPLQELFFGRIASFYDPDGHQLFIWQPPSESDERFPSVAPLVRHHEAVYARLLPNASQRFERTDPLCNECMDL